MAATDLLTLEESRRAVNLPNPANPGNHDTELALFVSGISGRVDELCGPVVQRAVTDESHSGGRSKLLLALQHVAQVSAVTEYDGTTGTVLAAETNASKPTNAYLLDRVGPYAWLYRRSSNSDAWFPCGRRNIVVSYSAGRSATTAAVTERFKLAASAVLRRVWKREGSTWSQTPDYFPDTEDPRPSLMFFKAVDPMVSEFLAGELLPPVGL